MVGRETLRGIEEAGWSLISGMNEVPPFVPDYDKPTKPGIWMNFDNTVSIYHVVRSGDDFFSAAQSSFALLKEAQQRFPDWPRVFYLDIEGHVDERHGFDDDFVEFQQEFWFSAVAPFLTSFDLPLTGPLVNPAMQRNDLPGELLVRDSAQ